MSLVQLEGSPDPKLWMALNDIEMGISISSSGIDLFEKDDKFKPVIEHLKLKAQMFFEIDDNQNSDKVVPNIFNNIGVVNIRKIKTSSKKVYHLLDNLLEEKTNKENVIKAKISIIELIESIEEAKNRL